MKYMNDACFLKTGWRLLQEKDAMWSKVLISKYGRNTNLEDHIVAKPTDSILWRDMSKFSPKLISNCSLALRNGDSIRFWEDKWIGNFGTIVDYAVDDVPMEEKNKMVADYALSNGNWNWAMMENLIPIQVVSKLHSILPPFEYLEQDRLIWANDKSGSYTVKSAYFVFSEDNLQPSVVCWQKVWRWKGPERMRYFIWMVTHNRIKTNVFRYRWSGQDPWCNWCNNTPESVLHVLLDCPCAMAV